MNQAPHVVNGHQLRCICGGLYHVGATAERLLAVAHAEPACSKFAELSAWAFLQWIDSARVSMPVPAVIARMEMAHAIGREPQ